nr:reverse transcriptase domain-containing protein [Tanacetum cinerariifolium]
MGRSRFKLVNYFFPPSNTTNLKNDITNFQQRFDETFSETWDHFKDLLRKCLHHGFSDLHQIDTFYNSLKQSDLDLLYAAIDGNRLNRTPRDALTIIENKSKELLLMNKASQQAFVKSIEVTCVTCGEPHPYYECLATDNNTFNASVAMGTYNQGANSRGDVKAITTQSSVAYDEPMIPPTLFPLPKEVERKTEATKDKKKLSLPDHTPTPMTLELATRSIAYRAGITEDVFVQVGKFTFPADFIVVDYDVDPHVPLILGRPFLRTARALIDVHEEELILRDGDEKLIFHADSTPKHPHKHGNESINMISFIDITYEDCFPQVLNFKKLNHPSSGSTTPLSDFSPSLTPFETSDSLLEEFADELALLDPLLSGKEDNNFYFKADLKEIEYLLNQYPSTESNFKTVDPIIEKFLDEPALDYLPLPRDDDDDDDDLFELKSDNDEWKKLLYGDCYKDIDFEKDKNKDSKMKLLAVEV